MRIKVVIEGGAVPPTDPIGLDPTKPGEATASVQQLLRADSRSWVVAAGYGRYPVSKIGLVSSIPEVSRPLPPKSNFQPMIERVPIS